MPGGIHPPIDVVLSWPVPNSDDPVTRPPRVATVLATILGTVSLFLVFARLWVRIYMQRNPDWDDWAMLGAVPFIVALTVMMPLTSDGYSFNRHVWDVEPKYFVMQRKFILAVETTFCIGAGLTKISILLFYRRLSSRAISNRFKWTTWITIGFIAAYSVAFSLVPIFGCQPISAYWEQMNVANIFDPNYKYTCFDEAADVVTANAISTAQDLLTAILPTFIYYHLQIPLRQKIALGFIFAIAYAVVAFGTMRLYFTWKVFYDTYDVTWVGWELWIWTLLELHVGVMCANAPALKAFFTRYFKVPKSSLTSSSGKSSGIRSASANLRFWKSSQAEKGYISEPYSQTTVDEHGGVRIVKEIHISQSHSSTNAAGCQLESIDGLEMVSLYDDDDNDEPSTPHANNSTSSLPLPSGRASREESLVALPSLPPPSRFHAFSARVAESSRTKAVPPAPDLASRSPPIPTHLQRTHRE